MGYSPTPEQRAKMSEAIHRWKPWEKATGPKTPEGKRRSAMRGENPEYRARQSKQIHDWKPWLKTKGPKTEAGKRIVAKHAYKGGFRTEQRLIAQVLREQNENLKQLLT